MSTKTIGQALAQLIKDLGIEYDILCHKAIAIWPETVGKQIANVSKAEKLAGKILFVRVKNDAWRNELLFLKKEIIAKLNKQLGKTMIEDLRFY